MKLFGRKSPQTTPSNELIGEDFVKDITDGIELEDNLSANEEEKEDRRRGCCLVGCLLLLLLLLLFLFALFLPVSKPGEVSSERSSDISTGAADWKLISAASYNIYQGIAPSSKGLYTVLKLKLTNTDSIAHQPNTQMVRLYSIETDTAIIAGDRPMIKLIHKNASTDPWLKFLEPGETRLMTIIFSTRLPGTDHYDLLLKDFDWTVQDVKKKPIGQIKHIISSDDPTDLESFGT